MRLEHSDAQQHDVKTGCLEGLSAKGLAASKHDGSNRMPSHIHGRKAVQMPADLRYYINESAGKPGVVGNQLDKV